LLILVYYLPVTAPDNLNIFLLIWNIIQKETQPAY
jgi:hypothetical protein